jgi:hypothetical protein
MGGKFAVQPAHSLHVASLTHRPLIDLRMRR